MDGGMDFRPFFSRFTLVGLNSRMPNFVLSGVCVETGSVGCYWRCLFRRRSLARSLARSLDVNQLRRSNEAEPVPTNRSRTNRAADA